MRGRTAYEIPGRVVGGVDQGEIVVVLVLVVFVLVLVLVGRVPLTPPPVHMYTCTYVHMYTCTYVHMYVCTCVHI